MDQCDSLITKLITMLLDWYSGDIYPQELGALQKFNTFIPEATVTISPDTERSP